MKPGKKTLLAIGTILVWCSSSASSFEEFDERYPKYSVPIYPNEAVIYLNTNPPSQAMKESRSTNVVCTSNKSKYFSGETIRLSIDIFYKDYSIKSTAITMEDEYGESTVQIKPKILGVADNSTRFYVEQPAPEVTESTTVIFSVVVDAEQGRIRLNVPVEVNKKMNKILEVGKPELVDNDIVLPVLIENEQAGFYRITATMFINNVPSARLMQQLYINDVGRQVVPMKMSNRLAKDRRLYGEAELKDIVLEKVPDSPGDIGGKSEPASFVITIPFAN